MKFNLFGSIKAKLMWIMGSIMVISISAILIFNYLDKRQSAYEAIENELEQNYHHLLDVIDQSTHRAFSLAELVANLPEVQQAFGDGDREKLKHITLPLYEQIKQQVNLDQFQFHIPPATSFLRLHQPEKFGDDLSGIRPTVLQVNRTHQPARGLEIGRFGLGIRGVVPVSRNGTHIGSVEFGAALNDLFLDELKNRYGFDAAVIIGQNDQFQTQAKSKEFALNPALVPTIKKAMDGNHAEVFRSSASGAQYLTFVGPLFDYSGKIKGVIVVPKDISAIISQINRMTMAFLLSGASTIVLSVLLCYWFINHFVLKRIKAITQVFGQAAGGNLTCRVEDLSNDEMGALSKDVNRFLGKVHAIISEVTQNANVVKTSSESLSAISQKMLSKSNVVASRAAVLDNAAQQMSSGMHSAAAAVEQTSVNVDAVSHSAQELAGTIRDIARNTSRTRQISESAVTQSQKVSEMVTALDHSAQDIGNVTETITDISEQTNLLALNATIEAARAGEAGRGFAVVANEIKELARQTSEATQNIRTKIEGIRESTSQAVKELGRITGIIHEVNDNVTGIASAVEQQSTTTAEISSNVSQASLGVRELSENIQNNSSSALLISKDIAGLSQITTEMDSESQRVASNSENLAVLSNQSKAVVDDFAL